MEGEAAAEWAAESAILLLQQALQAAPASAGEGAAGGAGTGSAAASSELGFGG